MDRQHHHPRVPHPRDLITGGRRWNDWSGQRLAAVFGSMWTVWAFVVTPLVILLAPDTWQKVFFYLASAWVSLFALPLLTNVGNRAEAARAAKADADHQALASVHTQVDATHALLMKIANVHGIPDPDDPMRDEH